MARTKTTANEIFVRESRKCMLDRGIESIRDLAKRLPICEQTVYRKFSNPENLTVRELRQIDRVSRLNDEAIAGLLGRKGEI
jgi:hypothetical protein